MDGDFDFADSSVTVNVDTEAIVNLSNGQILNAGSASVVVSDPNSFVVLASGQESLFGSFSNAGLTHTTGSTLVVGVGETVQFSGTLSDHAQVQGSLLASSFSRNKLLNL